MSLEEQIGERKKNFLEFEENNVCVFTNYSHNL